MNTFKKPVLLILGMLLLIFILWSFTKTMKEPDDTDAVKTEAETIQNIDKKKEKHVNGGSQPSSVEAGLDLQETQAESFEITDIIWGEEYYVALCSDGNIRQWHVSEEKEKAVRVGGIENAAKIMTVGEGRAFYAVTDDGALYMWGENDYVDVSDNGKRWDARQEIYEDRAVNVLPAKEFTLIDATDRQVFAIDLEGNLYSWGEDGYRFFYNSDKELYCLDSEQTKGTERIFPGAYIFHYMIREDGSVYSLMSRDTYFYSGNLPWIYPGISRRNTIPWNGIDFIQVSIGGGRLYLYELGETDIEQIAADEYTVFLYGEDGVLRYWDSNKIRYHDFVEAVYRPSGCEEGGPWVDVNGEYIVVDINSIFGRPKEDKVRITDMCAGDESVLFLMETGEVFMSSYQTYDGDEVEYWIDSTNPYRTAYTATVELDLKKVAFAPLEWKNIVRLNSDGGSHFTAVDRDGNYYVLDTDQSVGQEGTEEETYDDKNRRDE